MAYTRRTTVTVDPELDTQTKIQKLGQLINQKLQYGGYSPMPYLNYRTGLKRQGVILSRSMEVSWADMAIYVTIVWRSEADYLSFAQSALAKSYVQKLREAGYMISHSVVA